MLYYFGGLQTYQYGNNNEIFDLVYNLQIGNICNTIFKLHLRYSHILHYAQRIIHYLTITGFVIILFFSSQQYRIREMYVCMKNKSDFVSIKAMRF